MNKIKCHLKKLEEKFFCFSAQSSMLDWLLMLKKKRQLLELNFCKKTKRFSIVFMSSSNFKHGSYVYMLFNIFIQNPNDIAYVYSGYAPLSVRLAQYLARPGWRSITEVLNMLPGPKVEEVQQIPMGLRKRSKSIMG